MKTIKFKHGMAPYQAGESASFEDEHADKIVTMGYAEYVKAERSEVIKAKEAPPADKMVRSAITKRTKGA